MSVALAVQREHHIELRESRQLLAGCERVDEAKEILDKAAAVQRYLGKRTTEAMNAAEIRLRAERRLGELIPTQITRGTKSHDVTLSSLGVHPMQSSRWQAVASVPDEMFEAYIAERRGAGLEITTAGVLRLLPVETEAADAGGPDGAACSTESGACGPITTDDKIFHISALIENFYAVKDYELDPLVRVGTKSSLRKLAKQAKEVIKWLEALNESIKERTK